MEFDSDIIIIIIFEFEIPLLVQKFKIVNLNWNLIPRVFQIYKNLVVIFTCSVVGLFVGVLSKKVIWHFGDTWLISWQFPRRDMKPVVFLFPLKDERSQASNLRFGFPGYQSWSAIIKLQIMDLLEILLFSKFSKNY